MRSRIFLLVCFVYLAGFFLHALYLGKTVYGDGVYYYSWLRSVVVDHDIDFRNEYAHLAGGQPATPLGFSGNKHSVGPALFWSPVFVMVHSVVRSTGYELPYQLATGLASVLATLFGLLLLYRLLTKYFSETVSIMTVAAIAGATNLLFYGSLDTVNSHALTFFATTVFLSLVFAKQKQWFAAGIILGFLASIRMQDMLYGILLLPFLKKHTVVQIIAGFFVGVFPQLVAWQLLYGKFWVSPYATSPETFHFLKPEFFSVLFGRQNGLFLWTPMALIGAIGLFTGHLRKIPYRRYLIVIFLLELYAVASWNMGTQGASYSYRMLVSSLPILSFGIASLFSWLATFRWMQSYLLATIVAQLSLCNALTIVYFLLTLR